MESMTWLNSLPHIWCLCPGHFLSLPNMQSGRERGCEIPESRWQWPARGTTTEALDNAKAWRLTVLYEVFRRGSEVHLPPDSVIWWELFISFLLPQGFDTNWGSVGSCGLLIQKMSPTSSVIRKLHSDMRSFPAYVIRDCFIRQLSVYVHSQNAPLMKCRVEW